ncbi:MAG: hypothetical protein LBI85_03500 [Spirochaetaceae bacterium]|jgi:lipid-A-disaccharide synthase-like uncharacterized protein|nr:hypothetical protein [Spirochaetaceae bacterium]
MNLLPQAAGQFFFLLAELGGVLLLYGLFKLTRLVKVTGQGLGKLAVQAGKLGMGNQCGKTLAYPFYPRHILGGLGQGHLGEEHLKHTLPDSVRPAGTGLFYFLWKRNAVFLKKSIRQLFALLFCLII